MNKFIKNNLSTIAFLAVILIAVFLRFYQLGINPPSLDWDEVSLGYNAYSILKTGADEYGTKLPLSIRSFDDYKPSLYTYLTVLPIELFGLNEFSVRLPAAVTGALSVIAIYFLVKEILQKWDRKYQRFIALVVAFFLAISPWNLQFSRAAFEGNLGLFFLMLGILFFFKSLKSGLFVVFSSSSFVLSIYSYHSFRLLVPLLLAFLGLVFWQEIFKKKLFFAAFLLSLTVFTLPVYFSFVKAQDSSWRLSVVTIFSDPTVINPSIGRINYDKDNNDSIGALLHNRRIVYFLAVAKGYLDHFNPDFLFLHGDGGVQHHAVDMGMLYLWDLPFILVGIYILLKSYNRYVGTLLMLFLLAPLPSAITTGTPHPVRAIAMMPGFHIFAAVGVASFYFWIKKMNRIFRLCIVIFTFSFFILNFTYYLHQYYVHTPIEYGYFWQYGNKEAIEYARQHENEYEKIVMTYRIDQPYIYYLFYNKIDPSWYQNNWAEKGNIGRFERKIGKYEFRYIDFNKDSKEKDTLLIGTPDEIPQGVKIIKEIRYLDGSVAYRIVKT